MLQLYKPCNLQTWRPLNLFIHQARKQANKQAEYKPIAHSIVAKMLSPLGRIASGSILITFVFMGSSVEAKPVAPSATSKTLRSIAPGSLADGQLGFDNIEETNSKLATAVSEAYNSGQDSASKCLELMAEVSFNQRWAEFEQRIRSIHPLYNEQIMSQLREKERQLYMNSVEQVGPLERLMSLQHCATKIDPLYDH